MTWTKADYERLGDFIVAARLRMQPKWSRGQLAKKADISTRTLADIENGDLGKRKEFSTETLLAISDALGWGPRRWRAILDDQPDRDDTPGQPDNVWVAPEAALEEYELADIDRKVAEYRAYLIEQARRRVTDEAKSTPADRRAQDEAAAQAALDEHFAEDAAGPTSETRQSETS